MGNTMYQCRLSINLIGSLDTLKDVIAKAEPLDGFSHEIICSDMPKNFVLAVSDIIFFHMKEVPTTETFDLLKQSAKKNSKIILCTDHSIKEHIVQTDLSFIHDIWLIPQSDTELLFRFQKLQNEIKTEKDYWLTKNYLDTTINSVPHLIWYKNKVGAHLKVNESFCQTVNKTMEQIEGRGHYYIWDIAPDEYAKGEFICMESEFEVMQKQETCIFDETVKVGNEYRKFKTYKSPLFDIDGTVMGTVGIANDVTQELRYKEEIAQCANTDFLTGLYNRRYVYQYVDNQPEHTPITIFYLDLDNFKSVNDTYGHKEGDHALLLTKDILYQHASGSIIARIGGDEFLIIETKEYSDEELMKKCQWLEEQITKTYREFPNFDKLSVSIGCAQAPKVTGVLDSLILQADAMMYQDKKSKKAGQDK